MTTLGKIPSGEIDKMDGNAGEIVKEGEDAGADEPNMDIPPEGFMDKTRKEGTPDSAGSFVGITRAETKGIPVETPVGYGEGTDEPNDGIMESIL